MIKFALAILLVSTSSAIWAASSGSGFYVSDKGHLITNQHVVDGCSAIEFYVGGVKQRALVIAADNVNDVALLKSDLASPSYLAIGEAEPKLMEQIYVAGYPFGDAVSSTLKITKGIVSSLAGIGDNYSNIQIDAGLQPGNSGGPVVNERGEAIAIAVSKLSAAYAVKNFGSVPEGVNFAVKGSVVGSLLRANNIPLSPLSGNAISVADLSKKLTNSTVKLNCLTQSYASEKPATQGSKNITGETGEIKGWRSFYSVEVGMSRAQAVARLGGPANVVARGGITGQQYCQTVGSSDFFFTLWISGDKVVKRSGSGFATKGVGYSCLSSMPSLDWNQYEG